jgi:tetratricopeptide (TPR) repeat protein
MRQLSLSNWSELLSSEMVRALYPGLPLHIADVMCLPEDVRLKCQFWLRPANMNQVQESRFSMKLEGTCEWFWSHQSVKVWTTEQGPASRDRLLCVSGKSGCGKSILASSVVKVLRERHQRAIFFSFSGTDASRATLDDLVRSLLWQVLDDPDEETGLHLIRDLMAHGQPTTTDLWNVLNKVVEKTANELYWVVDGVDECSGSVSVMIDRINELLTRSKASKAIVLGRPHALEATKVSGHSIDIDSHLIQSDLHSYISAKVEQNQGLQKLGIKDIVLNTLLEKSEGMFLWAKLMVDELSSASSVKEVMHKIHHQPRGLQAVYRRILHQLRQNLDDFEVGLAQKLLAFIIAAGRPLTVEELNYAQALALRAEDESLTRSTVEDSLHMDAIQKIRRVCGGLVDIKDDKVSLVHVTAKEFLLRPVEEWSDHDTTIISFQLCMNDSHEVIGLSCLDHLSLFGTTLRQANEATNPTDDNPNRPFLLYAADFAVYHFNRADVRDSETITRIRKTMMGDGCVRWMEYVLVLVLDDRSAHTSPIIIDELRRSLAEDSLRLGNFDQLMPLATRQLAQRRKEFGENDWRTRQLQALLRIMAHGSSDVPSPDELSVAVQSSSQGPRPHEPENTTELLQMLRTHNMVPMRTRVELLLKLTNISQSVSTLTDPLEILFRLIMRNAVGMPVLILIMVGSFYRRFNKPRKALEVFVIALEKNKDGEKVSKSGILELIGRCHYDMEEFGEAATAFSEAVTDSRTKMGPRHEDTGRLLHRHGLALYKLEEYAAAKEDFQQALSIRQELHQSPHKETARSMGRYGLALYKLEDYTAAKEVFQQALSIWQELHQSPHLETADSMHWMGLAMCMATDYANAEKVIAEAHVMFRGLLQGDHEDIAASLYWQGIVLYWQSRFSEAEKMLQESIAMDQRLLPGDHPDIGLSLFWLGKTYYAIRRLTESKAAFEESLSMTIRLHGPDHADVAATTHYLGVTLLELDKFAEAEAAPRQAVSVRKRAQPENRISVHLRIRLGRRCITRRSFQTPRRCSRRYTRYGRISFRGSMLRK